jgi:hypothetical protein
MAENEVLAFPDKSIVPTDELIFSIIGERKELWQWILKSVSEKYKDVSWSWNYYNDGKQWLFKLVQKKKTFFWGAILKTGDFKITFYFGDLGEPLIMAADLPQKMKDDFRTGKRYGKIRAISILVKTEDDADNVLKVADIKSKLK